MNLSLRRAHKHTAHNTHELEYIYILYICEQTLLTIKEKIDITISSPLEHLSSVSLSLNIPLLISISHKSTCNEHITVKHIMEHLPSQWLRISLSDGHNVK